MGCWGHGRDNILECGIGFEGNLDEPENDEKFSVHPTLFGVVESRWNTKLDKVYKKNVGSVG